MKPMSSLFLRQSYKDTWDSYQESLKNNNSVLWDYVVITASNDEQALSYQIQISQRLAAGCLPQDTRYVVLPDPNDVRVGSGGATLNVLKYINEHSCGESPFKGKRILVIHSGGDSKRVPQYSACGKLFSPVPRLLPDGRRSTLFDEFIISMSEMPSRMKDGMLVLSGDVLLIFNSLQVDFYFGGVAAISIQESVEVGRNHGVYLGDGDGGVKSFLHKLPTETLKNCGAVNERGKVNIDTGAVLLGSEVLAELFSLVSVNGHVDDVKWQQFVNDKSRLSFYGDFLYPMAQGSTLEQYLQEKAEGDINEDLLSCRKIIWDVLHNHCMRLFNLSPAKFVHFGTTSELRELLSQKIDYYNFIDWSKNVKSNLAYQGAASCTNSLINEAAQIGENCYIEDSQIGRNVAIGHGCIISNVMLNDVIVPDNIVLHGLKLNSGKYVVRIYGVADNPKNTLSCKGGFLNTTIDTFAEIVGKSHLWENEDRSLWAANLYPACDSMEDAVCCALEIYDIANGKPDALEKWRKSARMSLCSSFNACDIKYTIEWQREMENRIVLDNFLYCIKTRASVKDAFYALGENGISDQNIIMLKKIAEQSEFDVKIRIYYYLFKLTNEEKFESLCFEEIQHIMLADAVSGVQDNIGWRISQEKVDISLPLRVNWGGGWSDTPPYCHENGGTVLNAAIRVNGGLPVRVTIKRLDDLKLVFESADSGIYDEFNDIVSIQDRNNPFDVFALHKAVLLACGIIPLAETEETLKDVLLRIGGGIYLSTQVDGIPRGSGLGTSSILAGACVKAIFMFLGQDLNDNELFSKVLCAEQIMSTGGGWQDQIGGLLPGIKFITTDKGLNQKFSVESLELPEKTRTELQERFVLINTAQRRLARNLLREIMGKYIEGNRASVEALYKIQRIAALMKFELEKGNLDGFSNLLNEHWELSKQLDKNSTNTCIEQIFMSIEPLIDGRMICGAGGGGFLQVILKKGVSREQLQQRLSEVFGDSGVEVWNVEFV